MKRSFIAGSILLALGSAAAHADTVNIEFSPAGSTVDIGDVFSVSILGHAPGSLLAGGGIDLAFDPAVLKVNSLTINPAVGDFTSSNGTIDNVAGTVKNAGFASWVGVSGDFTIATIGFTALAGGTSALTVKDASDLAWVWASYSFNDVTTIYSAASIKVNAVPLPAAAWLIAPVLAGLVRQRRARAA